MEFALQVATVCCCLLLGRHIATLMCRWFNYSCIILFYSQIILEQFQNSICYQNSQSYSRIIPASLLSATLTLFITHLLATENIFYKTIKVYSISLQYNTCMSQQACSLSSTNSSHLAYNLPSKEISAARHLLTPLNLIRQLHYSCCRISTLIYLTCLIATTTSWCSQPAAQPFWISQGDWICHSFR